MAMFKAIVTQLHLRAAYYSIFLNKDLELLYLPVENTLVCFNR